MPEFIMGLFAFLLVLLVWAVVGHGIWLVLRSMYRALAGTTCQQCGRKSVGEQCPFCRPQRGSPSGGQPSLQDDLVAAERLLAYSRFKRFLNDKQHASLAILLKNLKARIHSEGRSAEHTGPAEELSPSSVDAPGKPVEQHTFIQAVAVDDGDDRRDPRTAKDVVVANAVPARSAAPAQAFPHPLDAPEPPVPVPSQPRAPVGQRITAGLLKSFMEQSNIRWIELISAALIVVCSVGLVISLWSTLSSTSRFFPSLVFLLATAGVHGAGQYTLRRWKLQSTSRGILHIGLMLIPLAVLVGILLARREGELPGLDALTLAVVAGGTLIYGGLAVTACQSLFRGRWPVVAAATIVSSLTLIPIHYLGERGQLLSPLAAVLLLPLVVLSMWAALQTSLTSLRYRRLPPRVARRMIGTLVQSAFATGTAGIFWALAAQGRSGLSAGWWMAVGLFSAAWIGWGWTISLPPRTSSQSSRLTPLSIAGWCVALLGCGLLLMACWQVAAMRSALAGLLLALAVWWIVHGLWCRLQTSLIAGALAFLVGCAIGAEGIWLAQESTQATDWLSFPRVISLTALGLLSMLVTSRSLTDPALQHGAKNTAPPFRFPHNLLEVFLGLKLPFLIAGGVSVAVAAVLTLLASLVPWGETPFGGSWAPLMLCGYGMLACLMGILTAGLRHTQHSVVQRLASGMVLLGQGLLLLAAVRLCQTSPLLESSLGWLRPRWAWSVGLAVLAVIWSAMAAALRRFEKPDRGQTQNIAWLCGGAIAVAIASLPALWQAGDDLFLFSRLGWFLPLTYAAVFYAWRQSAWRELTCLLLYGWLASWLFHAGEANAWWSTLERPGTAAAFVTLAIAVILGFHGGIEWLGRLANTSPTSEGSDPSFVQSGASHWITAGPYWSAATLIGTAWIVLCWPLFPVVIWNLRESLDVALLSGFDRPTLPDGKILGWFLLSGLGLAVSGGWLSTKRHPSWLFTLVGFVPLWTAMAGASFVSPPFSLAAFLWILALWTLATEFAPLLGRQYADMSLQAWQQIVTWQNSSVNSQSWLVLARGLAIGFMLVGSAAFIVSASLGYLPAEIDSDPSRSWFRNLATILWTLGPAVLVGAVRWSTAVVRGESPKMIACSGSSTAIFAAACAAFGYPPAWETTPAVFLQVAAVIASLLACKTLGFATLRNLIGLRKLTAGQSSVLQLLPKSMKGQRWKQAEQASWLMSSLAFAAMASIGLSASVTVAVFPAVPWPGVHWLGGWLAVAAFLATVPLFSYLSWRRGASGFGFLAVGLGLAAPLAAVSYADWLLAHPSASSIASKHFEPYRLMVVLWLVALAVGLGVRMVATWVARPDADGRSAFSRLGEFAWVALAVAVGLLGLIATTQDPSPRWPLAELSVLACIAALSSVVSAQAWRGHVAAVLAAAGLWAWLLRQSGADRLESLWLVLWGPLWAAAIALVLRLAVLRLGTLTAPTNPYSVATLGRLRLFTVDQTVSLHIPIVSCMFSFLWVLLRPSQPPSVQTWWILAMNIACLLFSAARLWDPRTGKRGLSVYMNLVSVSLVSSLAFCATMELPRLHTWLLWLASGLGAMAVMAGLLRELIRESSQLASALRLGAIGSPSKLRHALTWMPALHTLTALLALLPSVLLVLALEERTLRIAATTLPFIGALAILPLASQRDKGFYRYSGLLLISASFVLLWWADLPSAWALASHLEAWSYLQRAFAALIAIAILYPALATWPRLRGDWERPLMHSGWLALAIGVTSGVAMLLLQLQFGWESQAAAAPLATKLLTLTAWIAIVARLLQFAARPHGLDQAASDEYRQAAVYAAQIGLALLCAAAYFHFPDLFGGLLAAWWPLIMFAIAMISAGLGHWLHRAGETIIADPVRQSSLLLPLIPLAGVWWIQPEGTQWMWRDWDRYAVLLLTAAALYGVQGWVRQSLMLRALSASLVLLSFWSFLHSQPNLRFLQHPQFWLLPPALGTLAFVEINRRRLDNSVLTAARYGAVLVAYLSSTAEIFLKAFEGQLWQPLLLLVLALAGVAAGMVLRIRAFLYCGAAFSAVALVGMVWHAQQAIGQVWPWWAFGIATGIGLIVVLGYFEKNRPRVVAYLEQLKQWE